MASYLKCSRAEEMSIGNFIIIKTVEGQSEICNPCLIKKQDYVHEKSSGLARITLINSQDDRALIEISIDDLRSEERGYTKKRFYVPKEDITEK